MRASPLTACWRLLILIAASWALFATDARAQSPRSGLIGGISLGGGAIRFSGSSTDPAVGLIRQQDQTGTSAAVGLYLGAAVTPRSALLLEISFDTAHASPRLEGEVRIGSERGTFNAASTMSSYVVAGAAQFWVASRVWVRGGAGIGTLDRDIEITDADLVITLEKGTGVAIVAASGVDLWKRRNFTLDAQFHFTTFALKGLRVNAPSVQIGLTWS